MYILLVQRIDLCFPAYVLKKLFASNRNVIEKGTLMNLAKFMIFITFKSRNRKKQGPFVH